MRNLLKNVVLFSAICALGQTARADAFNVTLDTSGLTGVNFQQGAVFVAQLNDGSGQSPDGNNTVTLSTFDFGSGGSFQGTVPGSGGTGGLDIGLTMTDSSTVTIYQGVFTPGSQMSFILDLTSNPDLTGVPDTLDLYFLDSNLASVPSNGTDGRDFLTATLGANGPTIDVAGGDFFGQPTVTPVPEPSTLCFFAGALLVGLAAQRRARCSATR